MSGNVCVNSNSDQPETVTPDAESLERFKQVLLDAARTGDAEAIAAYAGSGLDLNVRTDAGDTPLILAVYHGHHAAVDELLKHASLDINASGRMNFTALASAAFRGDLIAIRKLVKHGAAVEGAPGAQTPLMAAAMFGQAEAAKLLVELGADPHRRLEGGQNAIELAAGQGNAELAKLLKSAAE